MPSQFPHRSVSHELEELSERFVRNVLPRGWTCERPPHDYGVDLRVDIFDGGATTGLELLIQLKASAQSNQGDTELVRLRTATFNHLWSKLQVAMLVKFIEAENEAYWILLKDIQPPRPDQETFTVHIPKTNRLSTADWRVIQAYIRDVTDTKLAAMRRVQLTRRG